MHCGTQSNRAPRPRRACRACRQANRARSALAPAAQKKILRHAAFEHCIHNQGVSAFQLRVRAEQNLAPRTPFIINVTHIFPNNVADHWRVSMPDQIRRKNPHSREISLPTQRRGPRSAHRNKLALSARSNLFLGNHNPRPGFFVRGKIGGYRKATGPNKHSFTRQHRPALPFPMADVLFVQ